MTKYVAFLRAINVGGHTVKMEHLRKLFEEMGFSHVETFIASGNVIFETKTGAVSALEKKISGHLQHALGFEVDTFVRTIEQTAEIERRNPFGGEKPNEDVYVAFLHETPNVAARSALLALRNRLNDFSVSDREVYWSRLDRDDSIFLKNSLEKILKMPATTRNLTTIRKLLKKHG